MLLIFDGDCGFCTRTALWIERRLPPEARVEPWQSLDLASLGLTEADVNTAAWWQAHDGAQPVRGHTAVGQSLIAAGGLWKPIGWLIAHPPVGWIARLAYALVARNRSRMPGATDSCRLDTPD